MLIGPRSSDNPRFPSKRERKRDGGGGGGGGGEGEHGGSGPASVGSTGDDNGEAGRVVDLLRRVHMQDLPPLRFSRPLLHPHYPSPGDRAFYRIAAASVAAKSSDEELEDGLRSTQ